jgi:hypothetical protein
MGTPVDSNSNLLWIVQEHHNHILQKGQFSINDAGKTEYAYADEWIGPLSLTTNKNQFRMY